MRGLPPPPDDVATLVLSYDVDGSQATTWHWLFVPGGPSLTYADLRTVWTGIVFAALNHLTHLMGAAASIRTCRLTLVGSSVVEVEDDVAPNHGSGGGVQVMNAAVGIHWLTGNRRRQGAALTRMPGMPDGFTSDHVSLNNFGYSETASHAFGFLNECNAVPSPAGGTCLLGSLSRSVAGVPRVAALFSPFGAVEPVRRVATIRRRVPDLRS